MHKRTTDIYAPYCAPRSRQRLYMLDVELSHRYIYPRCSHSGRLVKFLIDNAFSPIVSLILVSAGCT